MNRDPDSPGTGLALFRAAWMLLWWHFCSFPPTKLFLLHCEPFSAGWTLTHPKRGEAEVVSIRIDITADTKLYYCVSLNVRFLSASKTFSAGTECPAGGKEGGKVWAWAICAADIIVWTNFLVLIKPVNLCDIKWQPFPLHADVNQVRRDRHQIMGLLKQILRAPLPFIAGKPGYSSMVLCAHWHVYYVHVFPDSFENTAWIWKSSLLQCVLHYTLCLLTGLVAGMGRLQTRGQAKAKAELLILF